MSDRNQRERAQTKALMHDAIVNLLGGGAAGALALYWTLSLRPDLAAMVPADENMAPLGILYGSAVLLGSFLGVCASLMLWSPKDDD